MSRTGGRGEVYRIYKVIDINFVHFFCKLAVSNIQEQGAGQGGCVEVCLLQAAGTLAVFHGAHVLAAAEHLGKVA